MEILNPRRRRPIAVNLWSVRERVAIYSTLLSRLKDADLPALDSGPRCPFLLDVGLTETQRVAIWQEVWDHLTLVRAALPGRIDAANLLRTAEAR
jgi:hypothetical protein